MDAAARLDAIAALPDAARQAMIAGIIEWEPTLPYTEDSSTLYRQWLCPWGYTPAGAAAWNLVVDDLCNEPGVAPPGGR